MEHIHNCGNCAHFEACDSILKRYAGLSGIAKDGPACGNYAVRIEDILGDDYDLDRLRELAELTKNIPHVCRFCVGCEMEPKDGHGCDEYDSFVFSTRRLRELMEADRDGRCIVLPCKIGDTLYRIQRFKRGKNWRKEAEYIRTVELNKNNFWRVVFEGELGETVFLTREAAENALQRGD